MQIIIKGKNKFAKKLSEMETNIRKEWGGTMTDSQLDRCKYIERKSKEKFGTDAIHIDRESLGK